MASTAQVEQLLRNIITTVRKMEDGDFNITYKGAEFILPNVEVDSYIATKANIEHPVPTAIYYPSYLEQVVEVLGGRNMNFRLFRTESEYVLDNRTNERRVSLSPASTIFVLSQLDSEELHHDLQQIFVMGSMLLQNVGGEGRPGPIPFKKLLRRVLTIKVTTPTDDLLARHCQKLHQVAEASLFHIAYGKAIGLSFSLGWERSSYRLGLRRDAQVQFPLRTYKSELLAYYQLAFGSDSLIMAYLALYKILEYFFTSSSDKVLHEKMIEKLVEPDFSHAKPKKLQDLARVIRNHDNKLDERRLLRTVFEHYFEIEELRIWITTFDAEHDDYLLTERDVFAEQHRVDTSNEQLFSSVANRIYHIRNALVHYKEGEISRFIPFSGQEAVLASELPLLLYLVEKIIIKTGKDL